MEQRHHDDIVESTGFSIRPSEKVRRVAQRIGSVVAAVATGLLVLYPSSLSHEQQAPPAAATTAPFGPNHPSSNESVSSSDITVSNGSQYPTPCEIAPTSPDIQGHTATNQNEVSGNVSVSNSAPPSTWNTTNTNLINFGNTITVHA